MNFRNVLFPLFLALSGASALHATHNVGGEIMYRKTGPLTVEAWIVTYTNAAAVSADRDTLTICWGDGVCEQLPRANGNGNGEIITPQYKKNIYLGTHTYSQAGQYTISMTDPNRSAGIINVNPPSSDNIPFHIESTISFSPEAAGSLFSPVLLELPLDNGEVGQPYIHVTNAFDADGDSLAYELTIPMQGIGTSVPNYSYPTDINPGSNNTMTLDPLTGKIVWDAPQTAGHYTIAILIKSYRNGQLVETVIRDMLIHVDDGFNTPPVLELSVPDNQVLDVFVGDTVQVTATATDPDAGQMLEISSTSGLYDYFQTPAQFAVTGPGAGLFNWAVTAEHLRDQPYLVVFKAKDDGSGFAGASSPDEDDEGGLATFKVAVFRVRQTVSVRPEPADIALLRLYPNPSPGDVTVEVPALGGDGLRLQVLNGQGKMVMEQAIETGVVSQWLPLSPFPSGVYTVLATAKNGAVWMGRVVKQ